MNARRQLLHALATLAWAPHAVRAEALALGSARILTGFPPGGTVDAVARLMTERLGGVYAGTLRVENRPGAGGRLAVNELRHARPDGSTLLLTPAGVVTLYPHLYPSLGYGPQDLAPVCGAATASFALAVGPMVPPAVSTLAQFLDWARSHPRLAAYGSAGAGLPPHLLMALLAKDAGVTLNHVPYRGTVPALQDTLGGQIAAVSGPLGDFVAHARAGRLRVLATSSPARSRFLPEAPTFAELGFKALVLTEWYGFFLPAKAPPRVVARAAGALQAALASPGVAQSLAPLALDPSPTGTAQLVRAVRDEHAAWAAVIARAGFRPLS